MELTEDKQDVKFCHIRHLLPQEIRESATDLIEIGYSGFPVVLMRAELLKKAGKNPFNPFVDDRCEWGFSGEDLAFFVRASIRSGASYAMDRRVHVPHYKRRAIEPVPQNSKPKRIVPGRVPLSGLAGVSVPRLTLRANDVGEKSIVGSMGW